VRIDASKLIPQVTWGTSPEDVVAINGVVPDPADFHDEAKRAQVERALDYMGLKPGQRIDEARATLREGIEEARRQGKAHAAGEMSELLMSLGVE
jgi:homoaconitase/3-isopropylmalate dehydratase large subunit